MINNNNTTKPGIDEVCNELESLVIRIVSKKEIANKIIHNLKDKIIYVDNNVIEHFEKVCTDVISMQKEKQIRKYFCFTTSNNLKNSEIMFMFSRKDEAEFWRLEWYDSFSIEEIIIKPLHATKTRFYKLKA